MSLVHQALRKAAHEKNRQSNIPAPPREPQPAIAPIQPRSVPESKPAAFVAPTPKPASSLLPMLLTLVALVAIVAIVVLTMRATPRSTALPASPASAATAVVLPPPADPPPPLATPAPTAHKLTGITKDPLTGKFLAVINGQLRGEDEYVDGAVVKKVERDRVTLDINGRESVVRLF